MMKRIKWQVDDTFAEGDSDEDEPDEDEERVPLRKNRCHMIWSGVTAKRCFSSFRVVTCPSEIMARKQLAEKNIGSYWDMCRNYQPDDAIE